MDTRFVTFGLYALGAAALVATLGRAKARLQLSRAKHRSLTGHARLSRRIAPWCRSTNSTRSSSSVPTALRRRSPHAVAAASCDWRSSTESAFAKTRRLTAETRAGISDLQFTDAYRVPFQYSRVVREHLRTGSFVQGSSGVTVTDLDGNRFYDLTGSYGVNVFGYDFYKDCMEQGLRAGKAARTGARRLPPRGRLQRGAAAADLGPRRGVVPHVGHRGGDAGGAACALPHAAHASCAVLRCLPRLVGGRAAGRRQSAAGARDLHAGRHVGGDAARAAHATRHRLRARQPVAGAASQRRGAGATPPWSTARAAPASTRPPTRRGSSSCAPSAASAASC